MSYSNAIALQMPSNYFLMSNEEMEYLEGGKFYGVNLSKKKCLSLADDLTTIGGVLSISSLACKGLSLIPGLHAAIAGYGFYGALATAAGLSAWFFAEAATKGGAYVGYESSKNKIVYGYGKY